VTGLPAWTPRDLSCEQAPLRWAGWGLLTAAAVLLSWMAVLGTTLPTTASAQHWRAAWIGLDVMETTALAVTGWLVLRRDVRVRMAASAAAAFLLADAWFDITTAQPTWDVLQATMLALFVELPLMALCAALAVTAPRWCVDSGRAS
jgi:hypothetical protein